MIVFAPNIVGALFRVPADGGVPVAVTKPVASRHSHRYPEFIAGGSRFLFVIEAGVGSGNGLYVGSLDGAAPTRLLSDASHAVLRTARRPARGLVRCCSHERRLSWRCRSMPGHSERWAEP